MAPDTASDQARRLLIEDAFAFERQLAAEGFGDDQRLEVHAVGALHLDARVGQAGFDQFADGVGVQGWKTSFVGMGS